LDSSVLVSAFLKAVAGGAAFDLLGMAGDGRFELFLSHEILAETERVLLTSRRIRKSYAYPDHAVSDYRRSLVELGTVVAETPILKVVRDPADDMVVACAVAASADYLVSRDDDLLSLRRYSDFEIVTPETFLGLLRQRP
jgi:putative PIN family toxin of toxin-antitoxin system